MREYQKMFQLMLKENEPVFTKFLDVHNNFKSDPEKWKPQFNETGGQVVDIIRDYERRLCGKTESGQYGKFSANLSQKFWDEIRKVFPKIDFVGIK